MLTDEMAKDNELKRVGRFGAVGILNTAVDFIVFNIVRLLIPVAVASVISGTVAMINSYVFNQRFTFRAKHVTPRQTAMFFILTMFGLYVIRPIVITFLTKSWLWPAQTAHTITATLGLPFSQKFITDNLALVCAIVIVLFYNYVTYKKWVFVK